jgi:hypothetical protein
MQEVINCPSCQRRLQVPDTLVGQDVQCPTCGATFVAAIGGLPPKPTEHLPEEDAPHVDLGPEEPRERPVRRRRYDDDDYGDYDDDDRYRRRRRRDLLPHRGSTVLTLGILSLVLGCLGIIFGPIAWAMGNTDMAEIRSGRMDPDGEGLTNAGRICGIIGTVLGIIGLVLGCLWFLAIGMATRRW